MRKKEREKEERKKEERRTKLILLQAIFLTLRNVSGSLGALSIIE